MSKFRRSRQVPRSDDEAKTLDSELKVIEKMGALLRTLREKKGWSLEELAKHVPADANYLAAMENGAEPIPEKLIKHFSQIFEVPEDYFL